MKLIVSYRIKVKINISELQLLSCRNEAIYQTYKMIICFLAVAIFQKLRSMWTPQHMNGTFLPCVLAWQKVPFIGLQKKKAAQKVWRAKIHKWLSGRAVRLCELTFYSGLKTNWSSWLPKLYTKRQFSERCYCISGFSAGRTMCIIRGGRNFCGNNETVHPLISKRLPLFAPSRSGSITTHLGVDGNMDRYKYAPALPDHLHSCTQSMFLGHDCIFLNDNAQSYTAEIVRKWIEALKTLPLPPSFPELHTKSSLPSHLNQVIRSMDVSPRTLQQL